jgi:hypothetical protein
MNAVENVHTETTQQRLAVKGKWAKMTSDFTNPDNVGPARRPNTYTPDRPQIAQANAFS